MENDFTPLNTCLSRCVFNLKDFKDKVQVPIIIKIYKYKK